MVNEIGDKLEDKKNENEPWTIRLGKRVDYNPSPFRDKDDFVRKTIAIIGLVLLGSYIMIFPAFQIFGIIIVGSALFCYGLSFYETHLFDKKTKHELR